MTAQPHTMTAHDAVTAEQYADDVMRAEQVSGLTITARHFHILAGKVKTEAEAQKAKEQQS